MKNCKAKKLNKYDELYKLQKKIKANNIMNKNKAKFNLNDKNIENLSNNDNKDLKRKIPKEFLKGKNILSRKKIPNLCKNTNYI